MLQVSMPLPEIAAQFAVLIGEPYTLAFTNGYVRMLISLWLFQFPIFLFAAQPK
jgi:hypothetical protein